MEHWFFAYLPKILPPVLSFIIGVVAQWYFYTRRMNKEMGDFCTLTQGSLKCLLRSQMLYDYRRHIVEMKDIDADEYSSFCSMANYYEQLKGENGFMYRVVEKYRNSPLQWGEENDRHT